MKRKYVVVSSISLALLAELSLTTSQAMETSSLMDQQNIVQPDMFAIPVTKEGYVSAQTRFNIVKELLNRHPELTINSRVSSSDTLWKLYEKDKSFIEKSIQNRSNKDDIQQSINYLHDKTLSLGWHESMSISDLNLIGKIWVLLLSSAPESHGHALEDDYGSNIFRGDEGFSEVTECLENDFINRYFDEYFAKNYQYTWIKSHGFVMPHVTPTGSCPLSVMKQSWGFWTTEGSNTASYIDFFAVPTNVVVNFDYSIDYPPCDVWEHDRVHANKYRSRSKDIALCQAQGMAKMLSAMKHSELTSLDHKKIDLAFFQVFHESQQPLENVANRIDFRKGRALESIESDITPKPNSFNSLEQYQTCVGSTERTFGIQLPGETLIEKYRSYLKLQLEGLELMEPFAHYYDDLQG